MAGERILFVDDDLGSRRSFAQAMRSHGFLVDLARSGEEAWELACHFPYAVIATDLSMKGVDGVRLIEQLRELQPDPVCLLVTGSEPSAFDDAVSDLDVIKKPWTGDQMVEALRQAVQSYHLKSASRFLSEPPESGVTSGVLLVGLEPSLAQAATEWLQEQYTVTPAASPAEALRLLPELGPTCVVASGLAAQERWLRPLCGAGSVVVLTRPSDDRTPAEMLRHGAQDCVPERGLSAEILTRVVELCFERARTPEEQLPLCTERHNSGLLLDRVRQATSRSGRCGTHAGVLLVGLDGFARVNDALGYDSGDEILARVGKRLRASVRESDAVYKLDRDEFALVLEDLDAPERIQLPAQRVLNAFATPFLWGEHRLLLSASVGAAIYPTDADTAGGVLERAQAALKRAKEAGGNQCLLGAESTQADGLAS